jgi:cell division cycle 14
MRHPRSIAGPELVLDIIPGRYILSIGSASLTRLQNVFSFSIEQDPNFRYQPFFSDFGPLSIIQIHIFLVLSLAHISEHEEVIQLYSPHTTDVMANSVLLAAAFRLIYLEMTAEEALRPFNALLPRLKPYRDASSFPSTFDLTIPACIHGLARAIRLGWYNPHAFDVEKLADLEMVDHGDMNWLIPNKLLAFASPYQTNVVQGFQVCTPSDIVPIFKDLGIDTIIRLNNKTYEEEVFKTAGFTHIDMYFPDGACPPDSILLQFLEIIEGSATVALHCKAGLGRTFVFFSNSQWDTCRLSFDQKSRIHCIRGNRVDSALSPWKCDRPATAVPAKVFPAPAPSADAG